MRFATGSQFPLKSAYPPWKQFGKRRSESMMKIPPDWNEFLCLLIEHRANFLIVGAHAVAANGRPRATQDLDIWVEPTRENAKRVCSALKAFGFPALGNAVEQFSSPQKMAALGNPPLRIDVMTSIDGVSFEDAWAGRLTAKFGEHEVGFLGYDQLIANKQASGRAKDLLDIELLREGRD